MAYVLRLEAIGDDLVARNRLEQGKMREAGIPAPARALLDIAPSRSWCSEVIGWRGVGEAMLREIRPHRDYSKANSVGSRGVYLVYTLHEGAVYAVRERLSWRSSREYFCRVSGTSLVEMTGEEARTWPSAG